jgi:hypothetical protein
MDFSKLSANEKMAVYGSVAAIIGGLVGGISGLIWLSVLAGIGVLIVVFMPMMSPTTTMPGSKGSLLVTLGVIAGAAAVLGLLTVIADLGDWFDYSAVRTIFFLIGVVGSLVLAWVGWQEFQAEGGKFTMGMSGTGSGSAAAAPPPPSAQSTPPPQAAPSPPPPAAPPPPAEPMRDERMTGNEPMSTPPSGTPPPMGREEDDQT